MYGIHGLDRKTAHELIGGHLFGPLSHTSADWNVHCCKCEIMLDCSLSECTTNLSEDHEAAFKKCSYKHVRKGVLTGACIFSEESSYEENTVVVRPLPWRSDLVGMQISMPQV